MIKYVEENITVVIKTQRIRQLRHVMRVTGDRTPRHILDCTMVKGEKQVDQDTDIRLR